MGGSWRVGGHGQRKGPVCAAIIFGLGGIVVSQITIKLKDILYLGSTCIIISSSLELTSSLFLQGI